MEVVTEAVECPDCGRHVGRLQGHAAKCPHCGGSIAAGRRGEVIEVRHVWPASEVRSILARFPEVRWDRLLRSGEEAERTWVVYGWVERTRHAIARSHDFVLIDFGPLGLSLSTSSPKHSADFYGRIGGRPEDHVDCERVSDVLGL